MFWKQSEQPHDAGGYFNQDNDQFDPKSRLQRLDLFVEQLKNTAKQSSTFVDFAELLAKYWSGLREVEQDITPQRLSQLFTSFLSMYNQFSQIELDKMGQSKESNDSANFFSGFNKTQLEVILDSLIVVFLLGYLWKTNAVDFDDLRKYALIVATVAGRKLDAISSEPCVSTAALSFSLWKIMTLWDKPGNDSAKAQVSPRYNNEHTESNDDRGGYDGSNQLDEKFEELRRLATKCDIATRKLQNDIADSIEVANKTAQVKDFDKYESGEWWARWWVTFLQEWGYRCFTRCLSRCGDLRDAETVRNQWFSNFESIWAVGCNIARTDRLNHMKSGLSGYVSRRWGRLPGNDEEHLWKWFNGFNEAALKAIELFKEKQRRAITQSVERAKQQNMNSILDDLKRFMSEQ